VQNIFGGSFYSNFDRFITSLFCLLPLLFFVNNTSWGESVKDRSRRFMGIMNGFNGMNERNGINGFNGINQRNQMNQRNQINGFTGARQNIW